MITGIAHACFTAADLDATVDFYCGKLGLTEAFPFLREDGRRFGVYLHVGGRTFLEFFEGQIADRADGPKALSSVEGQPYRH
ncbi:MAG TPA: VOC family protein, partial [Planctomycetota bacterium]|nr:VOC family protein [Planctomycetota bacterium]